ncbi:Kelch repeat-containing protein [Roseateles sp.]|uniref:Kelch repeat-containing protein n=1 Tax=Roseateles sp. TaxID=1971397 RepID=UPI0039EA61E1
MKLRMLPGSGLALLATSAVAAPLLLAPVWRVDTGPVLSTPRAAHQATLLVDGQVLLTGGCSGASCTPAERSAELVDGATGRPAPVASMAVARVAHAAARLGDGRVLVAGGWTGAATTASAEVFDPRTHRFVTLGNMGMARMDATLTPLSDGSALIAGGAADTNRPLAGAEVFEQNRFTAVGALHEARAHHAAVRLADGRVLVMGGLVARGRATASAEIYDPRTRTFSSAGAMRMPRCKHAALLLRDERVMVIAGSPDCNEQRRIAQTEIFDPRTGEFTPGPALQNPRYKIVSAAAVTAEGDVVVAGDAADVEVWTPGAAAFVKARGLVGGALAFSTATPLPGGALLVAGGYDGEIRPTARTWVVNRDGRPRAAGAR